MVAKLRATATGGLAAAVERALALVEAREAGPKFGDARDEKLSAKAYLAQGLANARTTPEKLRELAAQIEQVHPEQRQHLDALRGAAHKAAVSVRVDDGCALDPPSQNLHHLARMNAEKFTLCLVEIMQVGARPLDIVALAVLDATTAHPEAFGRIDDREAEAEKDREVATALEAIGRAWEKADAEFELLDEKTGAGRLVFRKWPTVPIYPLDTAGSRLVAALRAEK